MDRSPTPSSLTELSQWALRLPWWSYAVATVLVTIIIAASLGRDANDRRLPAGASLPVKTLDAGEFQPAAPLTLRGPTLPEANTAERPPAPTIANSQEFTPDSQPAKQLDANRSRAKARPTTAPEQFRCREIAARAQARQPLSDSDRDTLRKECPS